MRNTSHPDAKLKKGVDLDQKDSGCEDTFSTFSVLCEYNIVIIWPLCKIEYGIIK